MKAIDRFSVNGDHVEVAFDTRDTLLDLLRDRIGLTGTKEGCGNGNCGACTVLIDGAPVNACIVLARESAGPSITTIEMSPETDPVLRRVQQAMVAHGGAQCGFCTPGVILSAVALLRRNHSPSIDEIQHAIAGNICRCTGYTKILTAIAAAAGMEAHPNGE